MSGKDEKQKRKENEANKPLYTVSIQKFEDGSSMLATDNPNVTHNQLMMTLQGMIFQLQEASILQKLKTEVQIIKPGSVLDMTHLQGGKNGKFPC
jgi:hypothetical protein